MTAPLLVLYLNNGSLHGNQGKKDIHALMGHGSCNNNTGHHLRDCTIFHKLEIGFSGNIFPNNLTDLAMFIYPLWILHTRTFMRDKNLYIEEGNASLHPQQNNDYFILEDFIKAGIEGDTLSELNRCLLSLNATCRSNIYTGNGKAISINDLQGKENWILDQYIWPPQHSPHFKAWEK